MRLQNTIEKQKETKKLLEENLKISKATLRVAEKTKKYIFWSQIVGWLKLIVIIVPLILAALYLPSFLEKWREQIQNIFPFSDINTVQQLQEVGDVIDKFQK